MGGRGGNGILLPYAMPYTCSTYSTYIACVHASCSWDVVSFVAVKTAVCDEHALVLLLTLRNRTVCGLDASGRRQHPWR